MLYILILLAFLADRFSKLWAVNYLAEYGTTRFNALFTLRETYNRGIAFGLFQGVGPIVGWLTILVVLGLFVYVHTLPVNMRLMRWGLALVIGGALGNLLDRVTVGQVLDFIESPLRPGIFNVADVMINLGMILTLVGAIWQSSVTGSVD
ncbi:MAG: signal peptidase II [Chloroflexi bacterium]|nr:MAG: signal peptidase II [Chloroflexota bacterium]